MLKANAVVVAWLGLTVLAALAGEALPAPRWLLVHLFLLGAVTSAILIWSEHFTVTLLHARPPDARWSAARLGTANAGTSVVLVGATLGPWWMAAAGAAVIVAVVIWHTAVLVRSRRRALPGPFAHVVPWYMAAGAALAAGGLMGGLLIAPATPGTAHERLHAAHAEVNVLGWIGLAVLGTLFTLWPTVLRTRVSPLTRRASRTALRLAVAGLAVSVPGHLLGARWVTVAGLALYAAAAAVALAPLVETLRRRRPTTPAGWTLAAGVAWFEVALVTDLVMVAVRPAAEAARALETLLPLVLAGFVAQTLLGSLGHLLPAIAGGGPARLKENAALLERGWRARFAAANLAVPLLVLPVPGPLRLLGWALLLGSVAAFVVLSLAVVLGPVLADRPAVPAVAGVLVGCVLTAAAVVVAVTGAPAAGPGEGPGTIGTGAAGVSGAARTVEVTLVGMRIRPSTIEAPPGTRLTLRVTNRDGQRHDLRLSTGQSTPMMDPGASADLTLQMPATPVDGWCTVVGHRAAGMTMRIVPQGTSSAAPPTTSADQGAGDQGTGGHDPSAHGRADGGSTTGGTGGNTGTGRLDLTAPRSDGWKPYDATLRPAAGGTEHRIEIHAREAELEVAPGVRQRMWTFNGTVPGPVLRGRVGDVFTVTFVNDAAMGHGLDFHAGALAPDRPMRTIQPGERLTYRFRAEFAGAWLYHCSTMPMSQHIANGMYGAVIVDPPDLGRVDREYVLVQGELYLGEPGGQAQVDKIDQGRPDGWMFNGTAAGYDHAPLEAKAGERVRIWAVAAGPGDGTSLHVVGVPYDTVYKEGAYMLRKGDPGGAQALDLAPAQGGFVELRFPEPGTYPIVDHDMRHAEAGAHGVFRVGAP